MRVQCFLKGDHSEQASRLRKHARRWNIVSHARTRHAQNSSFGGADRFRRVTNDTLLSEVGFSYKCNRPKDKHPDRIGSPSRTPLACKDGKIDA